MYKTISWSSNKQVKKKDSNKQMKNNTLRETWFWFLVKNIVARIKKKMLYLCLLGFIWTNTSLLAFLLSKNVQIN